MKRTQQLDPQPEPVADGWLFNERFFADDTQMWSHLFHDVYGGDGSPFGSVYRDHSEPVDLVNIDIALVDGVWTWVADFNENVITIGVNKYLRDFEIDGWTCLRPIIDGVVYWPGVRVRSEEFKRALDEGLGGLL